MKRKGGDIGTVKLMRDAVRKRGVEKFIPRNWQRGERCNHLDSVDHSEREALK